MPTSTTDSSDWTSVHAYYSGDQDRLLVDAVAPLVATLRAAALIDRYFFLRYWVEGPHVRLRLRRAPGVAARAVTALVDARLGDFLARHPAPAHRTVARQEDLRRLFVAEYGRHAWDLTYGPAGMPVRPDNSLRYMAYEPEYDRYGGRAGVDLAEWHFEVSSDTVLGLLATTPSGRGRRLGLSAQLGLGMCATFVEAGEPTAGFLRGYRDFWAGPWTRPDTDADRRMAGRLRVVAAAIRTAARDPGVRGGPGPWLAHCRALRDRIGGADPPTRLLHSYLHMTNNRLGVLPGEEAYLAHLLSTV